MAGASTRSQADVRIKTFWDWEFDVRDPNGYVLVFGRE